MGLPCHYFSAAAGLAPGTCSVLCALHRPLADSLLSQGNPIGRPIGSRPPAWWDTPNGTAPSVPLSEDALVPSQRSSAQWQAAAVPATVEWLARCFLLITGAFHFICCSSCNSVPHALSVLGPVVRLGLALVVRLPARLLLAPVRPLLLHLGVPLLAYLQGARAAGMAGMACIDSQ